MDGRDGFRHRRTNGLTGTVSRAGFAHGPASSTSSTARAGGVVQRVTPAKVIVSDFDLFPTQPLFGVLTIHFVPEPSTSILFGMGVLALAVAGRKRTKKVREP